MSDDRILTELAALRAGQEQLQAGQDRLRVDMMARLDRLTDAVTAMRDDIKVNFGASETVRRANEHTREELRDTQNMVADMRRQLLSLGERLAAVEQKVA
jgi:hypothetical protein